MILYSCCTRVRKYSKQNDKKNYIAKMVAFWYNYFYTYVCIHARVRLRACTHTHTLSAFFSPTLLSTYTTDTCMHTRAYQQSCRGLTGSRWHTAYSLSLGTIYKGGVRFRKTEKLHGLQWGAVTTSSPKSPSGEYPQGEAPPETLRAGGVWGRGPSIPA